MLQCICNHQQDAWLKQEGGLNCPGKWWAFDPAATLARKPLNQTLQKRSSIRPVLIHAFEQSGCRVRVNACCELLGRRSYQLQSVYAIKSFSHLCIVGLSPNRSSQFSVARLSNSNNRLFVCPFVPETASKERAKLVLLSRSNNSNSLHLNPSLHCAASRSKASTGRSRRWIASKLESATTPR